MSDTLFQPTPPPLLPEPEKPAAGRRRRKPPPEAGAAPVPRRKPAAADQFPPRRGRRKAVHAPAPAANPLRNQLTLSAALDLLAGLDENDAVYLVQLVTGIEAVPEERRPKILAALAKLCK